MSNWFEDVIGGVIGFLVGGPIGAAIGAGLGEAAGGGSGTDILKAGTLGWLGGEFLPGMLGAEAAAGSGASLASMGGGQGLMAPGLALSEMGGGTGLTWGGLGELGALGGAGGMTVGELGSMGIGSDLAAMGGAQGLTAPLGAGTLGGITDPWYKQLFGKLGFGGGAGGGLFGGMSKPLLAGLGGMQFLGGLQQYQAGRAQMDRQQQYAQQLAALEANPSLAMGTPQFQMGQRAIERGMRAGGMGASGNLPIALAQAAGTAYTGRAQELAGRAGQTLPYSTPMTGLGNIGLGMYGLGSAF